MTSKRTWRSAKMIRSVSLQFLPRSKCSAGNAAASLRSSLPVCFRRSLCCLCVLCCSPILVDPLRTVPYASPIDNFAVAGTSLRLRSPAFKPNWLAAQRNRCTGKAPRRRNVAVVTPSTLGSGGPQWSSSIIVAAGQLRGPTRTRSLAGASFAVQIRVEFCTALLRPHVTGGQTQTTCRPTRPARLPRWRIHRPSTIALRPGR